MDISEDFIKLCHSSDSFLIALPTNWNDETEKFEDWNNDAFNYPFTSRKNVLNSFKLGLTFNDSTYSYYNTDLKLQKSLACLEPSYWGQINFIGALLETLDEEISKIVQYISGTKIPDNTSKNDL